MADMKAMAKKLEDMKAQGIALPVWAELLLTALQKFLNLVHPVNSTVKAKAGCDPSHLTLCQATVQDQATALMTGLAMLEGCCEPC